MMDCVKLNIIHDVLEGGKIMYAYIILLMAILEKHIDDFKQFTKVILQLEL